MKILIVDDMAANIEMMEMIFEGLPYEILTAISAKSAFEIFQRERPELLVLDWMMPDVSGLELVKMIRSDSDKAYAYIIMVTAKDTREDQLTALQSGVDDFLRRPFSPRELVARARIGERIQRVQAELRASREALEQAKDEWEATADAMVQLVCLLDRDGKLLRANRTLEEWGLGWRKDAPGQPLTTLLANVYPGLAAQFEAQWPALCARIDEDFGFEFIAEDETMGHYFEVHAQPIEGDDTRPTSTTSYAAVTLSDITRRRKLELALEEEHKKSERLLLNILPGPISQRLKQNERIIADEFTAASVLFTDMVGFTAFAQTISPVELINVLNDIFSRFDALTERHGMEKIKTVGDAYMAVAGVPTPRPDHAECAVRLGLALLTVLKEVNAEKNLSLSLRVGVHSGPLVAGVIGERKFAYDLWGATVNTANRLETNGVPGAVQISAETAALLPEGFTMEARPGVKLKGIGTVETYLLRP